MLPVVATFLMWNAKQAESKCRIGREQTAVGRNIPPIGETPMLAQSLLIATCVRTLPNEAL